MSESKINTRSYRFDECKKKRKFCWASLKRTFRVPVLFFFLVITFSNIFHSKIYNKIVHKMWSQKIRPIVRVTNLQTHQHYCIKKKNNWYGENENLFFSIRWNNRKSNFKVAISFLKKNLFTWSHNNRTTNNYFSSNGHFTIYHFTSRKWKNSNGKKTKKF